MILKAMREKYGYSQEQLSKEIGVSRSTIAMIETDKNQLTVPLAKKLAKVFEIDWREFFTE